MVSVSRHLPIFEGIGIGFGEFGLGKKVSVLVSENLVSEKKCLFRFRKLWSQKKSLGFGLGKILSRKKVSVSVSENLVSGKKYRFRYRKNLVSEKSLGFGFGKFGIGKKVSVSVSVKILVSSFSGVQLYIHEKKIALKRVRQNKEISFQRSSCVSF